MRRFIALTRSAALEALAEPLSAVLFLTALVTIHLVPVFHYHQFGEAGRLARECGFSALLVFGLVIATSAAVRIIGGEISRGTAAAALARPVPRPLFFCAKLSGVISVFLLFLSAVASATLLATFSSTEGACLLDSCECCSEASRIWQPGLRFGVCLTIGAFALAAMANRFWRARFCVTACVLLSVAQLAAILCAMPFAHEGFFSAFAELPWQIVPALCVLACGCIVFIVMAGALAVSLKPAPTAAITSAAVISSFVWPVRAVLPEISRFWLADGLSAGASVDWASALCAVAASLCLTMFWLLAGSVLFSRRELP